MKRQDNVDNDILLEFYDEDEYAFFKYHQEIEQRIYHDSAPVYVKDKYSNYGKKEEEIYRRKKMTSQEERNYIEDFFIQNNFSFLKLEKNHYLITSSNLNLTYFISFNAVNVIKYCLKLIPEKQLRKKFIELISTLSQLIDDYNSKTKIKASDDLMKEKRQIYQGIKFLTEQDIKNLSYESHNKKYFKIIIKNNTKIENNIYSIYKINKYIGEIDKNLAQNIFCELDYIYIDIYKEAIKLFNRKQQYDDNDYVVISSLNFKPVKGEIEIAERIVRHERNMTTIIEKECLKNREEMINNIIKKMNPQNH